MAKNPKGQVEDAGKPDERPEAEEPPKYDAEASQRVPIELLIEGEAYEVELVSGPVSDAFLAEYARGCAKAQTEDPADEDGGATARERAALDALARLFDHLIADVEGMDGERPTEWRELFSPLEKLQVLAGWLFALTPLLPTQAKKKARPSWGAQMQSVTTRMTVPFNGRLIVVSHTLRKPDAVQFGEYTALVNQSFGPRALDAQMPKFAALYDTLHVAHEHYRGAVPMHHKAKAVMAHFERAGRVLRKN